MGLLAPSVSAIDVSQYVEVKGRTLYYAGPIVRDSLESVKAAYTKDIDHLVIASSGGGLASAVRLGFWIKNNKLPVTIDSICLSACTYVAMASPKVTVRYRSRVGIHDFDRTRADASSQKVYDGLLSYYLDRVNPKHKLWVLELTRTYSFNMMYYLTDADFKKLGWVVE
jgi:hypothetical protein